MNRFRPNIVVSGSGPYAEDSWAAVSIGTMTFSVVKACARCATTTTNQLTAERGAEPLAALANIGASSAECCLGRTRSMPPQGNSRLETR
jgi:uncharacterized protein YcbX